MANGNGYGNSISGPVGLDNMEDTVEFRIMMAYAQRRRPGDVRFVSRVSSKKPQTQTPDEPVKRKNKKKIVKRFRKLFRCFTPQKEREQEDQGGESELQALSFRMAKDDETVEEDLGDVADRLTKITDHVAVCHGDLETDGEEDAVEKLVGLLLREKGDQLNETILKDSALVSDLFESYSFYEKVIFTFLGKMGVLSSSPDKEKSSPETEIALTCEVTTRLSAVDSHPMNRLMGFGARYLKDNFSSWAIQKGGYERALESEDEEEVH